MNDGNGSNWQERCERYFTSLTDNDKQKQRSCTKMTKNKRCEHEENCNTLAGIGGKKNSGIGSKKSKMQYWFRALDIHGIHFAGSVKNNLECTMWILITIIACGGLSFLLYLTINSFIHQNNNLELKSLSSLNKNHPDTFITVCNINLLRRSNLVSIQNRFNKLANVNSGIFNPQPVPLTEKLMKNTALWPIMENSLQTGAAAYAADLDQQFLPYSGMAASDDWGSLYGASMAYGFDIWKDAVKPTISEFKLLGHQANDMIIQCSQDDSGICHLSAMEDTDPRRGNCATFNVSENTDKVSLVINAEPAESIPVMTSHIGLSIQVYSADSSTENKRHLISPGNHLIIRNKKITSISRKSDCSESTDHSVQQCGNKCVDNLTYKYCQCHTDGIQNNQCRVNDKFEYVCSKVVMKLYRIRAVVCKCQQKCSEIKYETDSTTMPWPSSQHLEYLESSLQSKNFNKSTIKSSLAFVTVNIEPETFEELSEEQTITLLDLLSRIGGLSALMIGMSIVTVFQIIWLLSKMCFYAVISRRSNSDDTVEKLGDSEITSITWQVFKNKNSNEPRHPRFPVQPDFDSCLRRNNSRRSYLEPIEEERKHDKLQKDNRPLVAENQLFSHPWERTGHRRPYSTIINSNRSGGDEFPLFNYIDNRSNSPLPRCSTPDNSDYRSTARLVPADGDVQLYPSRNKVMTPADAIRAYGSPSPAKYQYNGPFYL